MALDGESIVDEDLVAWVSMGIQHIPRSEVQSLSKMALLLQTRHAWLNMSAILEGQPFSAIN